MARTMKQLTATELDFVDNYVSMAFLKRYGTTEGMNLFCQAAESQGLISGSCKKGSKVAYGTYLKNIGKLGDALKDYKGLDEWTKASMYSKISRGKAIARGSAKKGCFAGSYTAADLRELAASLGISVSGNRYQMCAQIQTALTNSGAKGTALLNQLFGNEAPVDFDTIVTDPELAQYEQYQKAFFEMKPKAKKSRPGWNDDPTEWAFKGNF